MNYLSCISRVLSRYNVPLKFLRNIETHYKIRHCKSDQVLLYKNEYWNSLIIVKKGILRFYYELPDGTEMNKYFLSEDECFAPLWDENTNFEFSMASLGESIVIFINLDVLKGFFFDDKDNGLTSYLKFENQHLKNILVKKFDREMTYLTMDATERYLHAKKTMPHIIERIPQYHLASYLGVTPVSLSRIRGKLRTGKKNN